MEKPNSNKNDYYTDYDIPIKKKYTQLLQKNK